MNRRTESPTQTDWAHDTAPHRCRARATRYRDPGAADPAPAPVAVLHPTTALPDADTTPTGTDAPAPEFARHTDGRWLVRLTCPAGTSFYGTGEVAGPLRRNGQTVTLWNTDSFGYTIDTPSLYQSHPWVLAVRDDGSAIGLLVDTTFRCEISLDGGAIIAASEGVAPHVYVLDGPTPEAVLEELAALIGTTPLPPRWALGFHQCRYSYDAEHEVLGIAEEFRNRWLPCDTIWMDIDYMVDARPFTIDEHRFPDAEKMILHLRTRGFRTAWILDPGIRISDEDATFVSGRDRDVFIRQADGSLFEGDVWPGRCAWPDFTSAGVRRWWGEQTARFVRNGADGVWNDMNEPAVFGAPGKTMPSTNLHDADADLGGPDTHARYHNLYGMQMVRATLDGVRAAKPDTRPFVLTRSNFLGGQRYAATWTGDNTSDWDHLRWSITMALSMGLSGQPFVGPDIGGFAGNADGHLFARWMGIGALLPFARGHSIKDSTDHEPWSFGPRCEHVCRLALERRSRLIPYLYTLFHEASRTGMPIARPLWFADPADASLRGAEDSFLLGADVLVRARTRFTGPCRAAVPAGRWASFEPAAPGDPELPELLLRSGAVLPLGPVRQHVGESPLDPLTLIVHPDENGRATGLLYEDAGDGNGYLRNEHRLTRIDVTVGADADIRQTVLEGDWDIPDRSVQTVVVGAGAVRVR